MHDYSYILVSIKVFAEEMYTNHALKVTYVTTEHINAFTYAGVFPLVSTASKPPVL